jgi:acyl dehydratase
MPVDDKAVGKEWPPATYEVGSEKIREYANAVGEASPIYHARGAAVAAGFRDLVAPPMFCVVYQWRAMAVAGTDPEVGMNLAALVHGGQEFVWDEPVCAGDVVSTTARSSEIYEKDGKGFYVFETVSSNQGGKVTVRGTWTNIVRGV